MTAITNLDFLVISLVLLVFLAGGLIKGGLGFGMPLVTISALPSLIPVEVALGVNAVVLLLVNSVQFFGSSERHAALSRFRPMLIGMAVGIPIGIALLSQIDAATLTTILGCFIMVFVLATWFNPSVRIPVSAERLWGVAAGIIAATTTAPGTIYAMYFVGLGLDRKLMLAGLGLVLFAAGVLVTLTYALVGVLDWPAAWLALAATPFTFAGVWVGNRLATYLSQSGFRAMVLGVLFILGANMVFKTAF